MGYSLIQAYGRWWRMRGRAETTLTNYTNSLRLFVREVLEGDEMALLDVDRDVLEGYVERRLAKSVNAADSDVRAFRSFFVWASGDGDEMDHNPAKRLRQPKMPEPPVRVATPDDLDRLIRVCGRDKLGRRDAAILATLYSGPRRSELVVLDLEHLDLGEDWLAIPKTKGGRPRRIPLHPLAVSKLDRYLRIRGDAPGPLFLSHRGERLRPNGLGQMITRRAREAGVEFASHQARRMLAENWLRSGQGSETGLMAMAGWTSTRMVSRYTRMHREELAGQEFRRIVNG